ncbi:uncharacterized protein LOC144923637 isoform X1 [Branchiostoma floridae x Branchiostoma belcheri]
MSSSVETNTTIDMERKKGKPSETRGLRANNSPLMTARAHPSNMTSLSYCAIFITLEVAKQVVTYATRHYNNGVYPISSSAIVCCIELVKLLMVLIPVMFTTGLSSFRPSIVFAVPSIIYCANNNLYLVALNYTTPPTWNVLIQSRVIMTALTYRIIFGRQISVVRWVALLLLMLGIALAQLAGSSSSPASQDIYVLPQALGLSLVSAAISTAASIITEYLFKNDKRPFMEQQVQMYAFGFLIASIWSAVATKGDVFKISGTESLRSDIVFLLVAAILLGGAGGLAVAAIIRSLDNIVKIYSASISILMTAAVCSFLFPEKFILNTAFVIAVLLILVSSILYDRQDLSNILPANMRVPRFFLTKNFFVLVAVLTMLVPVGYFMVTASSTATEVHKRGLNTMIEEPSYAMEGKNANGGPAKMHPDAGKDIPLSQNDGVALKDTGSDGELQRRFDEIKEKKLKLEQSSSVKREKQEELSDKEVQKRSRRKEDVQKEEDGRKEDKAAKHRRDSNRETNRRDHPKPIVKVEERIQALEKERAERLEKIMHGAPEKKQVMHKMHGHGQGMKVHGEKEDNIVHGQEGQKDEEPFEKRHEDDGENLRLKNRRKSMRKSDQQQNRADEKAKLGTEVPKVVHFVWDGGRDFRFHDLLSVKSARKHLEPEAIVFHAVKAPEGKWWKEANDIPTFQFSQISLDDNNKNDDDQGIDESRPKKDSYLEAKVDILLREGGIMLDTDTFVLKPFDPLLRYDCVVSRGATGLNLGVLIAKRGAQFLKIWKKSMEQDGYKAPEAVVARHLDLVHVEDSSLYRPCWTDGWDPLSIYYNNVDLDSNYAIKLEYDKYNLEETPETITKLDRSFGHLARSVYLTTPNDVVKSQRSPISPNREAVVPNEVHFVWFDGASRGSKFEFRHFLSVKAAWDYVGAGKVFFHTDASFDGVWWDRVIERENVKIVPENASDSLDGVPVTIPDHQELATALGILQGRGGIYLNIDVIGLKSFEPLRHYDVTMGRSIHGLSNAVICSKPGSEFLKLWTESFRKFGEGKWDVFASEEPFRLANENPHLLRIEEHSLFRPELSHWSDLDALYTQNVSLENNFAVQLFYDKLGKQIDQYDILGMESTFGWMARKLFYRLNEPVLRGEEPLPHDHYVVPNIFHYVWFTCHDFRFHHLLSVKSMYLRAKADRIIIWTDCTPSGHNWDEAVRDIPVLEVRQRGQPSDIWGNVINNVPHRSDITRMEVLKEYGGVYVDWDVFAMKPFHPLRRFDFVMGCEIAGLNNGLILSKKDAPFLKVWWENYKHFDDNKWNFHSVMEPFRLAFKHPNLILMEFNTLSRPGWEDWWDMKAMWNEDHLFPWSHVYGVHFIYSYHGDEHNPEDIKHMRGTFGQMARWVYYGQVEFVD